MAAALQAAEYQNAGLPMSPAGPYSTIFAGPPQVATVPSPNPQSIAAIYSGASTTSRIGILPPKASAPSAVDTTVPTAPPFAWPSIVSAPPSPFGGFDALIESPSEHAVNNYISRPAVPQRRMSGGEASLHASSALAHAIAAASSHVAATQSNAAFGVPTRSTSTSRLAALYHEVDQEPSSSTVRPAKVAAPSSRPVKPSSSRQAHSTHDVDPPDAFPAGGFDALIESPREHAVNKYIYRPAVPQRRMSGGEASLHVNSPGVHDITAASSHGAPAPIDATVAVPARSTSTGTSRLAALFREVEHEPPPSAVRAAKVAAPSNRPMLRFKPSSSRQAPNTHTHAGDPPEAQSTRAPINRSPFIQNLVHAAHVANATSASCPHACIGATRCPHHD
jgi:hypothetical protein